MLLSLAKGSSSGIVKMIFLNIREIFFNKSPLSKSVWYLICASLFKALISTLRPLTLTAHLETQNYRLLFLL